MRVFHAGEPVEKKILKRSFSEKSGLCQWTLKNRLPFRGTTREDRFKGEKNHHRAASSVKG